MSPVSLQKTEAANTSFRAFAVRRSYSEETERRITATGNTVQRIGLKLTQTPAIATASGFGLASLATLGWNLFTENNSDGSLWGTVKRWSAPVLSLLASIGALILNKAGSQAAVRGYDFSDSDDKKGHQRDLFQRIVSNIYNSVKNNRALMKLLPKDKNASIEFLLNLKGQSRALNKIGLEVVWDEHFKNLCIQTRIPSPGKTDSCVKIGDKTYGLRIELNDDGQGLDISKKFDVIFLELRKDRSGFNSLRTRPRVLDDLIKDKWLSPELSKFLGESSPTLTLTSPPTDDGSNDFLPYGRTALFTRGRKKASGNAG